MATPALADQGIQVDVIAPPAPFTPGQGQQLQVRVTNKNNTAVANVSVSVQMDSNFDVGNPQGCNGNGSACMLNLDATTDSNNPAHKDISFTLTAHGTVDVPTGQTATKSGTVTAQSFNGNDNKPFNVSLSGPAAAPTVPQLSGDVVNIYTGAPIVGAQVNAGDAANHTWTVGTDKDGKFKIVSTPDKPIAPGLIVFLVKKDTFKDYTENHNGVAGQPITNLHFTIAPLASPGASSTPSPGSGLASNQTDAGLGGDDTSAAASSGSGSGGGLSWTLIAIGGVLVALGIAAIVILLIRRKGDDDDENVDMPRRPSGPGGRGPGGPGGPGGPPPGRGGPRPAQPRRAPEPTTVMRGGRPGPGGPGPRGGGDQTMIARSPLADMPTQLHGRVPPGPAGPVGPPPGGPPPAGGYGQNPYASGQYGGGQPTYGGGNAGYPGGAPPNYGQPDPYGNAYGPQQHQGGYGQGGGYGQPGYGPDDYDEPPRGPRPPADRRVDWLDD